MTSRTRRCALLCLLGVALAGCNTWERKVKSMQFEPVRLPHAISQPNQLLGTVVVYTKAPDPQSGKLKLWKTPVQSGRGLVIEPPLYAGQWEFSEVFGMSVDFSLIGVESVASSDSSGFGLTTQPSEFDDMRKSMNNSSNVVWKGVRKLTGTVEKYAIASTSLDAVLNAMPAADYDRLYDQQQKGSELWMVYEVLLAKKITVQSQSGAGIKVSGQSSGGSGCVTAVGTAANTVCISVPDDMKSAAIVCGMNKAPFVMPQRIPNVERVKLPTRVEKVFIPKLEPEPRSPFASIISDGTYNAYRVTPEGSRYTYIIRADSPPPRKTRP